MEIICGGTDWQQEDDDEAEGAKFSFEAEKSAPPSYHPPAHDHSFSLI
jgi:hypothetical protein